MTGPTLLFALLAAAATPEPSVHYRVELAAGERALDVSACVRAPAAMRRFEAPHPQATRFLLDAGRDGAAPLERRDDALIAANWRAGECLRYRVDLGRVASAEERGFGRTFGPDLVAAPRTWLWRPRDLARAPDATIEFVLPRGWSLSVPWRPLDDAPPRRRFALGTRPPAWPALVAFGRFPERDLAVGADVIRYAALGTLEPAQRVVLQRFIATTAADVAATFPRAFSQSPQLALVPVGAQREAVPFGQSYRGGADALVLYVDPGRTLDEYLGNWTLTHELVHVVHPYLGDEGAWISEGIATYYQNVVRARAGRISADQGWRELAAGFGRGRDNASSLTLRETSRVMGERRLYMRGYWSGTALALRADLAWRTRDVAPTSLEAVINAWLACCRARERRPDPATFLAELDRLAGGEPVFGPLYAAHADRAVFPEVDAAWHQLGITLRGSTPRYDDAPAARALRRAIMGG
ncbi:MAG TPA: hypothetical protein VND91_02005 [Candidatus Saccharimonadia bacterium]|nr:hypothetical protein [Candidatus Saccharimonadia bacterium]